MPIDQMVTASLFQNMVTLSGLRAFNFALTLVTLPYLARVFGVEMWGKVVFVQLIINYVVWFTDWGFAHSAVRRVAAARGVPEVVARILVTTVFAQWALAVVATGALIGLVFMIPLLRENATLYFCSIGLIVGNVLTPLWFLSGLERIKESAVIQIAGKLAAIPPIFLFVKSPDDAALYLAVNSTAVICVGCGTLIWMKRQFVPVWRMPTLNELWKELRESAELFVSTLWANLASSVVPAALGIFVGDAELGYYNLADRVRGAANTLLHPITHALFPRMCNLFATEESEAYRMLKISGGIIVGLATVISAAVWMFAQPILALLGGADFAGSIALLKWLAFAIVLTTTSEFLIYQVVVPSGRYRIFRNSYFTKLTLVLVLCISLVPVWGAKGGAIAMVLAEAFLVVIILTMSWTAGIFTVATPANQLTHS